MKLTLLTILYDTLYIRIKDKKYLVKLALIDFIKIVDKMNYYSLQQDYGHMIEKVLSRYVS